MSKLIIDSRKKRVAKIKITPWPYAPQSSVSARLVLAAVVWVKFFKRSYKRHFKKMKELLAGAEDARYADVDGIAMRETNETFASKLREKEVFVKEAAKWFEVKFGETKDEEKEDGEFIADVIQQFQSTFCSSARAAMVNRHRYQTAQRSRSAVDLKTIVAEFRDVLNDFRTHYSAFPGEDAFMEDVAASYNIRVRELSKEQIVEAMQRWSRETIWQQFRWFVNSAPLDDLLLKEGVRSFDDLLEVEKEEATLAADQSSLFTRFRAFEAGETESRALRTFDSYTRYFEAGVEPLPLPEKNDAEYLKEFDTSAAREARRGTSRFRRTSGLSARGGSGREREADARGRTFARRAERAGSPSAFAAGMSSVSSERLAQRGYARIPRTDEFLAKLERARRENLCDRCFKSGHKRADCRHNASELCFTCGKLGQGHQAADCPDKSRAERETAKRRRDAQSGDRGQVRRPGRQGVLAAHMDDDATTGADDTSDSGFESAETEFSADSDAQSSEVGVDCDMIYVDSSGDRAPSCDSGGKDSDSGDKDSGVPVMAVSDDESGDDPESESITEEFPGSAAAHRFVRLKFNGGDLEFEALYDTGSTVILITRTAAEPLRKYWAAVQIEQSDGSWRDTRLRGLLSQGKIVSGLVLNLMVESDGLGTGVVRIPCLIADVPGFGDANVPMIIGEALTAQGRVEPDPNNHGGQRLSIPLAADGWSKKGTAVWPLYSHREPRSMRFVYKDGAQPTPPYATDDQESDSKGVEDGEGASFESPPASAATCEGTTEADVVLHHDVPCELSPSTPAVGDDDTDSEA